MGKRHYCDYCDKAMTADAGTIERHEKSAQHQQVRRTYWDAIMSGRDPYSAIFDARPICHTFIHTGHCHYGPQCRYAHPAPTTKVTKIRRTTYRVPKDMPKNLPPSLRPPPDTNYDLRYAGTWD
ncbi:hypothetical protein BDF19DRAFT_441901 [Syncephalis fuscata]|nr:hypothetical protein BDF19DRAFT_441901 [Syncephalis fuscata]